MIQDNELDRIGVGSGRFVYRDPSEATGRRLSVWYRSPANFGPTTPIVFALHGFDRAASYFRDCWAGHADRYGFLVIVPEFDDAGFPGGDAYNYGNVRTGPDGGINPRSLWSYPVLDRIFAQVQRRCRTRRTRFTLFGHSAGGQFAHRYVALTGAPNVELAIPTNCGWYMAPDTDQPFPIGLGGLGLRDDALVRYFERPLVLLLGDADTDEQDPGLARTPAATAQGRHRLARGKYYFTRCKEKAAALGADFNWRMEIAPGVGHDDREVAAPAARIAADFHATRH